MKWLWFAGGAAVVIVGGVAFFAHGLITKFDEQNRKLQAAYEERAEALRAHDGTLHLAVWGTLDKGRADAWLAIRKALAEAYRERLAETSDNYFHARETTNRMLALLLAQLREHKMGFVQYRSMERRWHALLARDEFKALQDAWRTTVFTKEHPGGLPLPPPATDATPEEIALVKAHAADLEATLHADLLDPLLNEIPPASPQ